MTTVLYVGRGVDAGRVAATFGSDGLTVRDGVSFDLLLGTSLRCRLRLAGSVPQAHRILDRYPVTAVVVDLRGGPLAPAGGSTRARSRRSFARGTRTPGGGSPGRP